MNKLHCPSTDRLFETILRLQSVDECYALFEDLCTVKELRDMSARLHIASLLDAGCNYVEVAEQVAETDGARPSSTTISRVKRCLEYGTGGYRTALDRANEADGEKAAGPKKRSAI